jgi:hypothetical protein
LSNDFLSILDLRKNHRGKVYSLDVDINYVCNLPKEAGGVYCFETTSKDVFLGLGAMGELACTYLAGLLEIEFQRRYCFSLLFSVTVNDNVVHVVRTEDTNGSRPGSRVVTFTLSRAGR